MLYGLAVTVIGPCNSRIAAEFGAGERTMGLLISTLFAGFIPSSVFAGYMVDRIGLKPVTLCGVALLGAGMAGFGAAPGLPALFAMMLLTGIGCGAVESAVNSLVGSLHPGTRVYSLNMLHVWFGIGALAWPLAAGYLLEGGASWRALYMGIGGVSLVSAVVFSVQAFPKAAFGKPMNVAEALSLLRSREALLLGMVTALYVAGEMGINSWIVRYFDEELLKGAPLAEALGLRAGAAWLTTSAALSLYWLTLTVGRVGATYAAGKIPGYKMLRIVTALSAVFTIAVFSTRSVALAAVFLALTGLSYSGIFPTAIAVGCNRFPERVGMASGLIIWFSAVGNVVFNTAIGGIAERFGSIRAGMIFASLMLFGMAACARLIGPAKNSSS